MSSIQPTESGKWAVRWREGSKNRSRSFTLKSDATKFRTTVDSRLQFGLPASYDTKLTLAEWMDEWLVGKRDVEPETADHYRAILETHVLPYLGHLPLASLEPRMLDKWQRERLDAGAGKVALGTAGTLLKTILAKAAKYDLIARNPALYDRPRSKRRIPTPATPEQIEAMRGYFLHGPSLQASRGATRRSTRAARRALATQVPSRTEPSDERAEASETRGGESGVPAVTPEANWVPRQGDALLISLMGYVGLRPGEALALEWSDLRADRIQVNKANRDGRIKSTKTGNSRFAPVPAPVRKELVEWQIATASPGALLFPRRQDGLPWRKSNFTSWRERYFKAARDAAGLPESFTPYSLRHSAASLLIAAGRPITEVAAKLGHSPSTCLATYAHVIETFEGMEPMSIEQLIVNARAA